MQKVVSFYEKLPRGPAPEPEAKGLLGRYAKKHMGKNPSARRKCGFAICGKETSSLFQDVTCVYRTQTDHTQRSSTSLAS